MATRWQTLKKTNRKLALRALEELVEEGTDLDSETVLEGTDLETDPDEHSPAIEKVYLDLPVPDARFEAVERLTMDGDHDIYGEVGGFGEDGEVFRIKKLDGIELFTNLRELELGGMVKEGVSLRPLVGLKKLTSFKTDYPSSARDWVALTEIPSLREVQFTQVNVEWVKPDLVDALVTLVNRGVAVRGVGGVARYLLDRKRFVEALAFYDHIVAEEYPKTDDLMAATHAVMSANNKGPVQPERARRYLKLSLPHAKDEVGLHYNAACIYLELGQRKEALDALSAAVQNGYPRPKEMRDDKTFDPLREDPVFLAIFEKTGGGKKKR